MGSKSYLMHIDGKWCPSADRRTIESVNPATEEVIATIPRGGPQDVEAAIQAACRAKTGPWSRLKPKERGRILYNVARLLEAQAESFAELETIDSGKPLQLARKEVLSTARYFEYYAGAADKIQGDTIPLGPDYINFVLKEPMGVSAHITPWNMPLNMVGRSVAPALAAGNTAVVKPSEFTSLTSLKLAEIFQEVGLPDGVFNVITGYGNEVGAYLSAHPRIDCLTFTGSVAVGRAVMKAVSEHIKPVVLELGGKSPYIVFADADPKKACAEVVKGITLNAGQICSAGSRLLVHASLKEQLLSHLVERFQSLNVGPGMSRPDMGPLVSKAHHSRVLNYIELGKQQGATLATGGRRLYDQGYFVSPTIFDAVRPQMHIAQEEIFGPVLSVIPFENEAQALEIANGVAYGLVAGLFTNDLNQAMKFAKRLQVGQVYINEYFAGGEEVPFGGQKQSGFGREKGLAGLEHYTQTKNVAIRIHE